MFNVVWNRDRVCGNWDITQFQLVNMIDFHDNVFIECANWSRHFIQGTCLDSLTLGLWHAYMSDSDVVSGVGSSGGVSQEFNQGVAKEARAQTAAGAGSEAGAVLTPAVGCCSLAPGYCRLCQTCCTLCCLLYIRVWLQCLSMRLNGLFHRAARMEDGQGWCLWPSLGVQLFMKLCLVC